MSYIESNNRAMPRKPEKISSTIMKPLELLKRFLFAWKWKPQPHPTHKTFFLLYADLLYLHFPLSIQLKMII